MRKKIPITYTKERVVLSDVLPYETPLIFSNRYFYKFLKKREKAVTNLIYREKHLKAYKEITDILLTNEPVTKPFTFNISHKQHDYRMLNIVHPSSQLRVAKFYDEFNSLILYYSAVSPYSIRKPTQIAKFTFYNDLLHKKNKDGDLEHAQIEQEESEYENLKSFFTYEKYSNIHKFFESYQFHRCEKKYTKLLKLDISKCFDSIYTHTVSWALYNKNIVKQNIDPSLNTFAGKFDFLMQKLNANETNGIVIGPEFSRIFAELILQQIDKTVHDKLKIGSTDCPALIHKVDYEIFRYVDDFFIFYNKEIDADHIIKELKLSLADYKMYLNDNKSVVYSKPIITEISLAKQKITDLFNEHLKIKERNRSKPDEENDEANNIIYFSSNNVITRFKSIVKETNVDYKDIMNYSLAVLDKKTAKLINNYKDEIEKKELNQKEFEKGFLEILDVAFFLYSVSPKVNSTIKLCLIVDKMICFLKKNKTNNYCEPFLKNNRHNVFKKISDEIFLILQKNKTKSETQIETLYLLIALNQLGRDYRLNFKLLCSYFNIKLDGEGKLSIISNLNYFSITVLLFYIKDIKQYEPIKDILKEYILKKFDNILSDKSWKTNTEMILLLFDTISCPYLNIKITPHLNNKINDARLRKSKNLVKYIKEAKDQKYEFKKKLLNLVGSTGNQIAMIEQEKFWFIKWTDFDFRMELQAKRSQEVY